MKEPKAHYEIAVGEDDSVCYEDGKAWPCKTWRKWMKSDSYRLATLEQKVQELTGSTAKHIRAIDQLRTDAHRAKLLQNAQMEWLAALNNYTGQRDTITVDRHIEMRDVTAFDSRYVKLVPGPETFQVKFGDGDWKS